MKKNILFLDIDGTLYDYRNNQIPPSAIHALELASKTTEIVIATGRAPYTLNSIEPIKHLVNHYILINGQFIKSYNKIIYRNPIEIELIEEVVKYLEEYKIPYGFQGEDFEAISHLDESLKQTFDRLGLVKPIVNKDFYLENEVYQMFCFGDEEKIKPVKERFNKLDFIRWLDVGFDILTANTSKGEGILKMIELLNWHNKNIYAIGDGDNDYEMIARAQIGIAMGNATTKLKEAADYITTNIDEDGLYKALKYLKLF